jgi:hypothetical protein
MNKESFLKIEKTFDSTLAKSNNTKDVQIKRLVFVGDKTLD